MARTLMSSMATGSSATTRRGFGDQCPGDDHPLLLAAGEVLRDSGRGTAPPASTPTRSSMSAAWRRASSAVAHRPWMRSGWATASPIVMAGLRAAWGSWNTGCIRRRRGRRSRSRRWVMSRPSNSTVPAVGSTRRRIARPSVVLPLPLSPTRPSVSPRADVQVTPSTARTTCEAPRIWPRNPPRSGKWTSRSATRITGSLTAGSRPGAGRPRCCAGRWGPRPVPGGGGRRPG